MKRILFIFTLISLLSFGCGGGSGDSGSAGLSNNACGDIGLGTRIINGTECGPIADSPVVRVSALNGFGEIIGFCSGSAVTQNDIVTAAHCFPRATSAVAVTSGNSLDSGSSVIIPFARVKIHPSYAPLGTISNTAEFNDVAIVPLTRNLNVRTIPVLASRDVVAGEIASIFGYGQDEAGDFNPDTLLSGQMRIASVTNDHIQANFNGEGSNTCSGDSGGPMTVGSALVGITSTGINVDCSAGDESLFTNVQGSNILDFLSSNIPDLPLI
ncbi:MAG: trypsin-like serine protease [Bdellovibrionota bacterium]